MPALLDAVIKSAVTACPVLISVWPAAAQLSPAFLLALAPGQFDMTGMKIRARRAGRWNGTAGRSILCFLRRNLQNLKSHEGFAAAGAVLFAGM